MSWLRSQFRTFAAIRAWIRERLSSGGKLILLLLIVGLPLVSNLGTPLYALWLTWLALLVISTVVGNFLRPNLELHLLAPELLRCGASVELAVRIRNTGRRPAYDQQFEMRSDEPVWELQESQAALTALAPGEESVLRFRVRPLRRGVFSPPELNWRSGFPLQLVYTVQTFSLTGRLHVAPTYRRLHRSEFPALAGLASGQQPTQQAERGHDWDYVGSREYVPGLPVRRWDYASWARLGRPVVREFSSSQQPTATLWLDNLSDSSELNTEQVSHSFERVVASAAALADLITREDFRIARVICGSTHWTPGSVSAATPLSDLLRFLATVELQPSSGADEVGTQSLQRAEQAQPGTMLMVLSRWDRDRQAIQRQWGARGWAVAVVLAGSVGDDHQLTRLEFLHELPPRSLSPIGSEK